MESVTGKDGKEYQGNWINIQYDWECITGKTVTELNEKVRAKLEKDYETIGNMIVSEGIFIKQWNKEKICLLMKMVKK